MTSVLSGRPLSYPGVSEGRASAVHEPNPPGPLPRVSSIGQACPPAGATESRRPPTRLASRVGLTLKPGQKGTKQLLDRYGARLICVRYRYDPQRKKRLKTVEISVAERDWEPPRPAIVPDQIVPLRVAFAEVEVRQRVKEAGGTWNPRQRMWQLSYDRVVALGLDGRIVTAPASSVDA